MSDVRPVLIIDPAVQGGVVCIQGTRVPASAVAGAVFGGDSVDAVAEDYVVDRQEVLLACWWYVREYGNVRRVQKTWGKWAEQAHIHFARMLHPDKLGDPPRGVA